MSKEFKDLSNGYVFQYVFKNLNLLTTMAKDLFDFNLTGYRLINSEYSKVSDNKCVMTLTNGTENVIVYMKNDKISGSDDHDFTTFMVEARPLTYEKMQKEYPTTVLAIHCS